MDVYLIALGRKMLTEHSFDFGRLFILLSDKEIEIKKIVYADSKDELSIPQSDGDESRMFIVAGDTENFGDGIFSDDDSESIAIKDNDAYVKMPILDENLLRTKIIPYISSVNKTSCNNVIIKTYGKDRGELEEMLADCIKNRNKISFGFYENEVGYDVRIRYPKTASSAAVNDVITKAGEILSECTYALKDISLTVCVARAVLSSGKHIAIAESFTGGGIASALTSVPGMSKSLIESVVCYSHESKTSRLGVPQNVIDEFGAVSADTAFEMANGLLANPSCDVAVATTGNAGPTSENDEVGLFFIAIGDRDAIHVFKHNYNVKNSDKKSVGEIRREITEAGINTALFELGKFLKRT